MTQNGKGSQRRGSSKQEQARYAEGWDRIFGKKDKASEKPAKERKP